MVFKAEDIVYTMRKQGIEPNVVTYTTLMQGMFQLGRISAAGELWRKMLALGQVPNLVTCSILLDGYRRGGKIEEALKVLRAMQYSGLKLNIISYTILIDVLCKAGRIEVAKEVFGELSVNASYHQSSISKCFISAVDCLPLAFSDADGGNAGEASPVPS
ncbi:pentatricopeptide repeat-containing protein At1g62930, chloroplastic-like [Hibiscus syriacus]|uniref:pentatricopeptide repeat-containing protein At1g62930, chloroplastic-like n=1 Tax=Hibiscus syriacus TaxID=106335 RepID=UPI0019214764|nr:pentatricopeptide repeat-containing protein At1g62930, chloroplastic-like [Hibiscus syriacus]